MSRRVALQAAALAALIALTGVLAQTAILFSFPSGLLPQPYAVPADTFMQSVRVTDLTLAFFAADTAFVLGYTLVFAGLYTVTVRHGRKHAVHRLCAARARRGGCHRSCADAGLCADHAQVGGGFRHAAGLRAGIPARGAGRACYRRADAAVPAGGRGRRGAARSDRPARAVLSGGNAVVRLGFLAAGAERTRLTFLTSKV